MKKNCSLLMLKHCNTIFINLDYRCLYCRGQGLLTPQIVVISSYIYSMPCDFKRLTKSVCGVFLALHQSGMIYN